MSNRYGKLLRLYPPESVSPEPIDGPWDLEVQGDRAPAGPEIEPETEPETELENRPGKSPHLREITEPKTGSSK